MHQLCPHACLLSLAVVSMAWVAGCKAEDPGAPPKVQVVVFAASSLTDAFGALERGFEQTHPHVDVQMVFAGSQILRLQIEQGAGADLFASAHQDHMQALETAQRVATPRTFARNELVIISPPSAPLASLEELALVNTLVIGTDHVPIGIYTQQLFKNIRARRSAELASAIERRVVSKESNVRLARAKVELGEADAAIVYRTDAASSDKVRVAPIPDALNVRARYLMAATRGTARTREASLFMDHVLSPAGQSALRDHGFLTEAP